VFKTVQATPAEIAQPSPQSLILSGCWSAGGIVGLEQRVDSLRFAATTALLADAGSMEELDTAGAWLLQKLLTRLHSERIEVRMQGLRPEFAKLLTLIAEHVTNQEPSAQKPLEAKDGKPGSKALAVLGQSVHGAFEQGTALLAFVGETTLALVGCVAHPARWRWRPILFNIRSAGFDALPIVALLSFLLGIVVAYQGADQLRQYGANIFVADLVGLSMLREFAPLITAIIIAGRSGSAYAAQIGTMAVTEEIDAMRTLGIAPLELLVLPKIIALVIALPLLTVFADVLGVFGGMIMARAQLGVGYGEFLDRFVKAVSLTSYAVGIGKTPVFAAIISLVGCFQGFRTHGGADSVGRQTTRAVVQAIFLVIVADALFSIAFSVLDL
jgi:phospholipid/cholesterol/gamma-HCH transport system permease protein